jgi:hypothetical protein
MLPEWSRIVPDGENFNVLAALTPGVTLDGRRLAPGQAVFIPAWGRPADVTADNLGARVVIAYPHPAPTSIWRHTPGPDPAAGQLPRPQPSQPLTEAVEAPVPAMAA